MIPDILRIEIAGNELWRITVVFCILLVSFVAGRIIAYAMARAAKQKEKAGEEISLGRLILRSASGPTVFLIFAGALDIAFLFLKMSGPVRGTADTLVELFVSIGIAYFLYRLVDVAEYYLNRYTRRTDSNLDNMLVPLIRKTFRIVIIILAGLYIAESVSGKPMSTIIAGLGLGGLAFALAAQDTIKNFFGSIMILLDKPFVVGDRVVVDGFDGPVEEVGFRSTKIRTLSGHLVTVPNEKVVSSNIENVGRRPYIRRVFNVTITYDTPPDKVERAVEIIKKILDNHEGMLPDFPPRVFFNEFNDASLNILVIYWYHPPDYWKYLEFCQTVNMRIFRAFEEEGIEFAFPTQTLYLANDDRRQLSFRFLEGNAEASDPTASSETGQRILRKN
ncbi:MAG: mechanosensitive ion channel family protein [Candidatus Abyssobacteria bacterium SURF_5]|jgi:MscS family membrane protein|uniref:Mechanosensitive ion channel family protein n=1 Tax=Abyssobacteria bacterium (strain SURF_5) TaxID=2093360 RepID=A0A3A4NJU4_ABYX5|nr:MAG: mechanosensitive ion channel family protein [Candidatus Abyssubacteria bacterium SURF_5]